MTSKNGHNKMEMSDQEAAIYDRQIRLWGVEAQRRLRDATILIVGFRALGAEICKNLVLAGMNVTIADQDITTADDVVAHIFLNEKDIGKKRADASLERVRELNPLVQINVVDMSVKDLLNEENLKGYTLVCFCDIASIDELTRLDDVCRSLSIGFFSTMCPGFTGFLFTDLGAKYEYLSKTSTGTKKDDGEFETIQATKEMAFLPFSEALKIPLESLKVKRKRAQLSYQFSVNMFASLLTLRAAQQSTEGIPQDDDGIKCLVESTLSSHDVSMVDIDTIVEIVRNFRFQTEVSPICAIMGGIVGQELIKAVSGQDEPINNFFCFDGLAGSGTVRKLAI